MIKSFEIKKCHKFYEKEKRRSKKKKKSIKVVKKKEDKNLRETT